MKIKQDFITNSSSSSFIVIFSKENPTMEEIRQELFGDKEFFTDWCGNEFYCREIAKTIYADIGFPLNKEEIISMMYGDIADGNLSEKVEYAPEWTDYLGKYESFDAAYDAYLKDKESWGKMILEKFMSEIDNGRAYRFGYSDNDGAYYSFLEHGRIFGNVPFIQISYH